MRGQATARFGALATLLTALPGGVAALAAPQDQTPDAAEQTARRTAAGGERHWALSALATVDILGNARGGRRTGVRVLDKVAAVAAYDGGDGWTGVASAQYINGAMLSGDLVGDVQTASNIEGVGAVRVYEVWLGRDFAGVGHGAGVKAGLIDLNADFDVQEAGGLFLNSSAGIAAEFSHTGRNGPSIFPTTALALTGYVTPAPGWRIDAGVFDGVPGDPAHPKRFAIRLGDGDGALFVAQATRRWGERLRAEAGGWTYTAHFDRLEAAGGARRASRGAYGLVEARLAGTDDSARRLTGWLRVGVASTAVNRIDRFVGGGVVLAAPFAGRERDSVGIAVFHAGFGGPARRSDALRAGETAIEATWHVALGSRLGLQPDVQYIVHPGGIPGVRDAVVAGARLTFAVAR